MRVWRFEFFKLSVRSTYAHDDMMHHPPALAIGGELMDLHVITSLRPLTSPSLARPNGLGNSIAWESREAQRFPDNKLAKVADHADPRLSCRFCTELGRDSLPAAPGIHTFRNSLRSI
ncbi:hypothetical protein SCLCIDRAFT_657755 [Scleroderma citrinum Foug A]|uniref:Uncharacterized protein n=1 Tax=Scleroderma citrinum Foug A TaxID=1036808 RepID=A0A0C3AGU7_9AGAM|nr:hypothetical protein SCLCIDRAFT_657755 [Scleroderma citrinum Foug A]